MNGFLKKFSKLVVVALAIFGAWRCWIELAASVVREKPAYSSSDVVGEQWSPNHHYRTILVTHADGTSFSFICRQSLLVLPSGANFATSEEQRRYTVFSANGCPEFLDHKVLLRTTWSNNENLDVQFATSGYDPLKIELRTLDASKQIRIHFSTE
jgi:hypothetical protein